MAETTPFIQQTLVISDRHLEWQSRTWLEGDVRRGWGVRLSEEQGRSVHAEPTPPECEVPRVLGDVLAFARAERCAFVLLFDGERAHPDVPVFVGEG